MRRLLALVVAPALVLCSAPATAATMMPSTAAPRSAHNHADVQVRDAFKLATFNVLGHSHTERGGKKAGYADSTTRMRYSVEALDKHNVQVVGFQEFEEQQKASFKNMVGDAWEVWSGSNKTRNTIAWRRNSFEFVSGDTIMIPYFYGTLRPMPVALLRSKATGQAMYFANFHLPANTHRRGDEEVWRDRGTRKLIELAHRLRNQNKAVFILGDMNEREEFFCKFTANGDMHAANGGSNRGGCQPPRYPNRTRIDWLFGSSGVNFSEYVADESELVQRATDHALVVAKVH